MRVIKQKPMTVIERLYIFEAIRGLWTTRKHAARGLFRYEELPTITYPEGQPEVRNTYRAKHRLMLRPDGTPRCVACGMCAAACPAHCIFIEATQSDDPRIEKRVMRFDIDHLTCVFCGLCAEACPVDALRMDTKQIISNTVPAKISWLTFMISPTGIRRTTRMTNRARWLRAVQRMPRPARSGAWR